MACIKSLFSDSHFAQYLVFQPERHYSDVDATMRLWHDMHTGKWWWNTQKDLLENGAQNATIIPIIISTDQTKLTLFKDKVAYPVYLTIGNLPKEIRKKPSTQSQILLAYLPVEKLTWETNDHARRRMKANLFHMCMKFLLDPIIEPGLHGIPIRTGSGQIYNCHPIFATHIGDYPEQCLVTCVKQKKCPTCLAKKEQLGDWLLDWITSPPSYDLDEVLEAVNEPNHKDWPARCKKAGINPFLIHIGKICPMLIHFSLLLLTFYIKCIRV